MKKIPPPGTVLKVGLPSLWEEKPTQFVYWVVLAGGDILLSQGRIMKCKPAAWILYLQDIENGTIEIVK